MTSPECYRVRERENDVLHYLTTSARGIKSPALDSAQQQQWPGQSTVLSEVYKHKYITSRRRMAAV